MIHLSPWSLSYSSTQAAPTHGSSAASSKKLGIKPTTKWKLKTIESKIIEREIGEAAIECLGEKPQQSPYSPKKKTQKYSEPTH